MSVVEVAEPVQAFLPSFASLENRLLDEQVRAAQQQLQDASFELMDTTDRVEVMAEHLVKVQHEMVHSQLRLSSRKEELASEKHLQQLLKRERVCLTALYLRPGLECSHT